MKTFGEKELYFTQLRLSQYFNFIHRKKYEITWQYKMLPLVDEINNFNSTNKIYTKIIIFTCYKMKYIYKLSTYICQYFYKNIL